MSTNPAAEATARKTAATAAKKPAAKTPAKKPATAKVPQDHKPAQTAKTEATGEEVTVVVGGREWTVSSDAMDDFELLGHLNNLDSGGNAAVTSSPVVMKAFLGPEQFRDALNMIRDPETGKVSVQSGIEFVGELLGAFNPNS